MPAATSVPNVTARMTIPAIRPMASLRLEFADDSCTPSTPPASALMPAARAGAAAAMTRPASSGVTAPPLILRRTWASPVLPSSLSAMPRPPRMNGLVTL